MIEISKLSYGVGDTAILRDISLSLPEGKLTALIGPNGAGKSTLLSLIARLVKPASGTVLLDGDDVHRTASAVLARRLSVLRQSNSVASRLSVRDLVGFGRFPYRGISTAEQDRQIVDDAIERLTLAPLADRFLDTLSGGQQQRAMIAMILAQDTATVLLDEPLNNLDISHARQIMKTVAADCRKAGKQAVVVLHDLNYAIRYSDYVVALKDGKVFATGPVDEVITAERMSSLFDTDVDVIRQGETRMTMHY